MKLLFLTLAIGGAVVQPSSGQPIMYNESRFNQYRQWFERQSPTENLFQQGATLYVFSDYAPLRAISDQAGELLLELPAGTMVENISDYLPTDRVDGHDDWWFRVRTHDANGCAVDGYIWGGHVARAWQQAPLLENGQSQLIMLGLAAEPLRTDLSNLQAEVRIAQQGHILYRHSIPKMCVSKDCASRSLLRVLPNQPRTGEMVLEASTLVVGCTTGIDKAFLHWTGRQLQLIYMQEYTRGHVYIDRPFELIRDGQKIKVRYEGENAAFDPVWQFSPGGPVSEQPTAASAGRAKP